MLSSLLSPCEVKLHILQSAIYLVPPQLPPGSRPPSPSRAINQPPATNDVLVRGLIELYVPSDRKITAIKVKLRAVQTVAVLDPLTNTQPVNWEETVLLEKRLLIPDNSLLPPSRPSSPTRQPESSAGHAQSRNPIASVSLLGSLRNRSLSRQPRSVSRAREPEVIQESRGRQPTRAAHRGSAPGSAASSRTVSPSPSPAPHQPSQRSAATSSSPHDQSPDVPAYSEVPPNSNGFTPASPHGTATNQHPNHPERPDFGVPQSPSQSRMPSASPAPSRRSASVGVGFFGNLRNASRSRSRAPPSARRPTSGLFPGADESAGGAGSINANGGTALDSRPNELDDVLDEDEPDYREGRSRQARGRADVSGVGHNAAGHARITSPRGRGGHGTATIGSGTASRASSLGPSATMSSISTGATSHASSSAQSEGLELSRGVHGFEFAFILPSDSPPYERSPYGRVRYILKATAVGGGRARSDVSVWRDIFPVVNPSPDGGPVPLQVLYNDIHPTVGLLSISCTSNSISVGGIFNVDIASPLPPPDLTVYLVRISLETHIELFISSKFSANPASGTKKKRERQVIPPQRRKLFERGYVPPRAGDPHGSIGDGKKSDGFIRDADLLRASDLEAVARGGNPQSWEINAVARMPDDNAIRPSTVNGTRADVRFSHVLIIEIVHSRAPEEEAGQATAASAPARNESAPNTPGATAEGGGGQNSPSPFANLHPSGFFDFGGGPATGSNAGTQGSTHRSASKGKSKERDASRDVHKPQRKIKVFTLRQPIVLPSCCVAFDSVQLPPYTSSDSADDASGLNGRSADLPYDYGASHIGEPGAPTRPVPRLRGWEDTSARQHGPAHEHCVCGQSLDDLRQAERALEEIWPADRSAAIRAGWSGAGEGVRRHGKIGEYVAVPPSPLATGSPAGVLSRRRSSVASSSSGSRSISRTRSRSREVGNLSGKDSSGVPVGGLRRLSVSSASSVRASLRGRGFSVGAREREGSQPSPEQQQQSGSRLGDAAAAGTSVQRRGSGQQSPGVAARADQNGNTASGEAEAPPAYQA